MEVNEQPNTVQVVKDLWADFFPHKNTEPARVPAVVANKEWMRESLIFFGWRPFNDKLDVNIIFIDGGAVLLCRGLPCCLISVNWSDEGPALRFTYVDNRTH